MKVQEKPEKIYNYFLSKECDPVKAMGLCYFSYAWGLLFLGYEIAPFKFEKRESGPVDSRLLESEYRQEVLEPNLTDFLYFVWTKYGSYSGEEIMQRAKKHPPFINAKDFIKKRQTYLRYR